MESIVSGYRMRALHCWVTRLLLLLPLPLGMSWTHGGVVASEQNS